jgi:hypothetical protein
MEATNNTGTPQSHFNWKNLVLVFLHVVVLIVSISGHPIKTPDVLPGALPEALDSLGTPQQRRRDQALATPFPLLDRLTVAGVRHSPEPFDSVS